MIETSLLYKNLFNAGAMQEYRIEIADIMYDQDVIYDKTEISENLFDTNTFTVGSFTVSSLKVKLWLENHEIPRNAEIKFYYRYANDVEQSEWILKFVGNVVNRTRYTDEITTIEAYSKAANYDVFLNHFGSAISSYPANARTVANLCATHLGLTIENIEDVYNGNIVEYPNELTMVQVLQNIAKSSGGNWAIVEGDKLRLAVLENTTPILEYPARTIAQSELLSPISMVRVYWKDDNAFEAGDDSGSVLEINNPWATQTNTVYLLGILNGYEYVPVKGQGVYADPALQLGDTFRYSNGVQQTVAKVTWTFDGTAIANIETPQDNEIAYDNPYDVLVQQEFKKKVTLGESYQGVSIGRENGLQMLLSPDGTEENAVGRYYADLNKGMAFQTRNSPSEDWHDWMYFDMDEKTFKLQLYSTKQELQDAINTIELTAGPKGDDAAVFSDVPPEDTSRLWLDTSDNTLKQFMLVEEDGEQVEGWYPVTYHAEQTLSARIKIAEDAITSEVAERVDLKGFLLGEISTQVAQEADSITTRVTSVAEDLTTAEGRINTIETFFRIDGDGVALGKSDNEIEFYAEPNEIGFRQTGAEGRKIAYWKEGTMHVDNLIALKTIIVGHHHFEKYPSPIAGDSTIIRRGGGEE